MEYKRTFIYQKYMGLSAQGMSGILPTNYKGDDMGIGAWLALVAVIGFCVYMDKRNKRERQLRDMLAYKHFWPAWDRWDEAGHRIALQPLTGQAIQGAGFWDFVRQYRNDSGVMDFLAFDELIRQSSQYKGMAARGMIQGE